MLGIHELWLFVISGLLLNIAPGPDIAYIIGRSMQLGWRGGAAATFGISCGCLVHVFGAALGLSALLMASSTAFAVLKLIGAAYLVYVGIKMLISRQHIGASVVSANGAIRLRQVFWQGALTDVLNPKVALFFLAFLPQFVAADAPHKAAAFVLLGLIFVSTGTVWCLCVAAFSARLGSRIRRSGRVLAWINRALGGVFVYLGVRVAMLESR